MPFIVGFPRSGTTLLRLILDAHSELAITHEAGFIPVTSNLTNPRSRMFYKRLKSAAKHGSWANSLREEFYRTLTQMNNWNDFHVPSETFRQALIQIEPFTVSEGLRAFFQFYAARFNKPRCGDKTPFYNQYLGNIENVLPEAHFIHIIRDGRDAALSGKGLPFVADDFEAIGREWSKQILITRRQSRACRHYLEIRYEDLILETTAILQKICRFINLRYEPRMQRYYQNARDRMDELGDTYDIDESVSVSKASRLFRHSSDNAVARPEPHRSVENRDDQRGLSHIQQGCGSLIARVGLRSIECKAFTGTGFITSATQ